MAVDDLTVAFSQQFPPADRFWTNALGGNYNVAANWLSNAVPQPQDTANFTNETTYQVDWPASAVAASAIFNAGSGTVTQAIGASSWTIANNYVIGKDAVATAAVTHITGTLLVTNSAGTAQFKAGESGGGTFNLAGGEVIADTLLVTNGSKSVFNFTGGTLRSRNTTVNNGSRLTVGTNSTAGTFELLGGSHSFANGLTIQSNSLLTGTGDISANVTVNGSISPGPAQGGIGQLNFNSGALNFSSTTTNVFEINKAAGTNDTITCVSIITLNGTLIVTNLGGTLTNGDRFQLFSGFFNFFGFQKLILPPLAAGLSWKNDTHKDGSIQVVQTPARDFGEDVSHFQGDISQSTWNQMFAEGKRFAFIKATEGLTGPNDLTMSNNVARAGAAGLLAGVYHLAHPENRPTTNGAVSEATNFLAWAGSAIGPGRLRPVLDLEFGSGLTTTELTDWVIAFSNEITNNRGPAAAPIIYTIQSFAQNELDSRLANYDLWLAAYSGGSDPQADDPPPFGLSTNALGVFNNWSFWQYSDTGSSGGITPLDLDVCHSEYKPLSSYLIPSLPPTPIQLVGTAVVSNGAVQFSFTNTPGTLFTVLTATNPALPLSNWTVLGSVTETAPGQFQFTDLQATNNPQRFYRVRSP
jgi:GH25 family lysozyme M1 (1,4-beta-N-acetylmuramidase)